jgi:hypothetical protein
MPEWIPSPEAVLHACTDLLERAVLDAVGGSRASSETTVAAIRDCERQLAFVLTHDQRIAGGSEPSADQVPELMADIRCRLVAGILPPLTDNRVWGGPATGKACHICGGAIEPPDLEFEIEGTVPTFLHSVCHKLWLDESRRQRP